MYVKIEPASRDCQADTLTTQPRRLVGFELKSTQFEQNLVLSRVVTSLLIAYLLRL